MSPHSNVTETQLKKQPPSVNFFATLRFILIRKLLTFTMECKVMLQRFPLTCSRSTKQLNAAPPACTCWCCSRLLKIYEQRTYLMVKMRAMSRSRCSLWLGSYVMPPLPPPSKRLGCLDFDHAQEIYKEAATMPATALLPLWSSWGLPRASLFDMEDMEGTH